jgi:hypothetical protein
VGKSEIDSEFTAENRVLAGPPTANSAAGVPASNCAWSLAVE